MKFNTPANCAFPFSRMSKNNTSASKLIHLNDPTAEAGNHSILQPLHPTDPTAARQAPLLKSRIPTPLHLVLALLLLPLQALLLRLVEPPITPLSMHNITVLKPAVPVAQAAKLTHMPRMEATKTTLRTTSTTCSSNSKHKAAQRLLHQVAAISLHLRHQAMVRTVATMLCRRRRECERHLVDLSE